jgi:hypothetical protein
VGEPDLKHWHHPWPQCCAGDEQTFKLLVAAAVAALTAVWLSPVSHNSICSTASTKLFVQLDRPHLQNKPNLFGSLLTTPPNPSTLDRCRCRRRCTAPCGSLTSRGCLLTSSSAALPKRCALQLQQRLVTLLVALHCSSRSVARVAAAACWPHRVWSCREGVRCCAMVCCWCHWSNRWYFAVQPTLLMWI